MARAIRIHVPALGAGERELDPEASKYLTRVQRLSPGARFIAFDPETALEADGELIGIQGRNARVRLDLPRRATGTAAREITLLQAIGKGDKADQVVRDATALGAAQVVLVQSERSVVRMDDPARTESRRRRWQAIAVESARQSGRADLPGISGPTALAEALAAVRAPRRIVLDPRALQPLGGVLTGADNAALALLIGPEGGLAPEELALAERHGFVPASLGALVLRTETAAIAVLGAVLALSAPEPGPAR
jgi:16S rRNA (uracil1498-N3)-methyltransferase